MFIKYLFLRRLNRLLKICLVMVAVTNCGAVSQEVENQLLAELDSAYEVVAERKALIYQLTGSRYPLSDEAFCGINPNTKDEELRAYIEAALLIRSSSEEFLCKDGIEPYSRYFSMDYSALFWSSLANNNLVFYKEFEVKNGPCKLKKKYPEAVKFLLDRGYSKFAGRIYESWGSCEPGS